MSAEKILIDTNIIIGLEDNKEIDAAFSALQKKCQENDVQIYIHEASRHDLERDKDDPRKRVILSKLDKFLELRGIPMPAQSALNPLYGKIIKPNDFVDVTLLYALHDVGAVDFLVTQDRGIHKRARQLGVDNRVFTVDAALVWLRDKYEKISVPLPFIEEKQCQQVNRHDDIFTSLQADYSGFNQWFDGCIRKHRACWTINFNSAIAGIAIRKDETYADLVKEIPSAKIAFLRPPQKITKVCTFKIHEKFRGEKFGEQLLKQILWWACRNTYDLVYLTVYPKHKELVDLLQQYGFENIARSNGEMYLAKSFSPGVLASQPPTEALEYHRKFYPNFKSDPSVGKLLVPIKPGYYKTLFPENMNLKQVGLFDSLGGLSGSKIPGNTIRKVYICHAQINSINPGDILLFFQLKDENSKDSQCLVTVGIVDGFDITDRSEDLLRLTAKRSVFSKAALEGFTEGNSRKVKVINFLLAGHIKPPLPYIFLEKIGITGPYQSIRRVDDAHYKLLEQELHFNEY